ncbi:MAG: hypothetical protein LBP75_10170 [Planctomycetota bacterium]|jgi:hypothetical protein|nr:hypothetical protein [Planctomycetota bacterium]
MFDLNQIYKVRKQINARWKKMTPDEIVAECRASSARCRQRMATLRRGKAARTVDFSATNYAPLA